MFSRALIRIMLTIALSSLCVAAQIQQPAAKTDKSGSTGVIKGRVVNESGQPLANAIVSARAPNSNYNEIVVTDRDGAFQISELEPSLRYSVVAAMPAYTSPRPQQGVAAPTYRTGDSVSLTLIKGAVITGTVTNAVGEPVVGIRVRVEPVVRDRNGRRLAGDGAAAERQTDDRGVYRFYGLPAGTYVVLAGGISQSYSSSWIDPYETDVPTYANSATRDTATEITVRAGEEVSGVDIRYRFEQGRIISGTVTGASQRGFNIMLSSAGDVAVPWTSSAYQPVDDNFFSFAAVAEGDYDLFAYASSETREHAVSEVKRIRVRGADVTGIELTTRPLGSVAGRVVLDETKPPECTDKAPASFADMTVGAWHNDNEQAKETPQTLWNLGAPVRPDAQGNFVMRNLAPGEYFFAVRNATKNWYVRSIQFPGTGAKKPIDATRVWTSIKAADQVSGLSITLAHGGASFRGQLALGEGEQVPPRTFVYLAPVERERSDNALNYFGAAVEPDGKMVMNNIPPGRYWMFAETIGEGLPVPLSRLRFPLETEMRAQIRRAAEAGKIELELKPCQDVTDFKLKRDVP